MDNFGFDDHNSKRAYFQSEYDEWIETWSMAVTVHGKNAQETKIAQLKLWHSYLAIAVTTIQECITDDMLLKQCIGYVHSLSTTYSISKCKTLLDAFIELVEQDRNWIRLHLFMQRNPVS